MKKIFDWLNFPHSGIKVYSESFFVLLQHIFFDVLGSTPPEVNIDEDSSIGSNVVTFKAFGDLNEAVKYAVAGGNIGKVFDVDSLTGIVYVNQTLDYETHDR